MNYTEETVIDWYMYEEGVKTLEAKIIWDGIRCIVGVNRGGLVLAVMLSHLHNDITVRCYNSGSGNSDVRMISKASILVVDDIVDTGSTMKNIIEVLGNEIKTASLFYRVGAKIEPNFYWSIADKGVWIKFPYEVKGVIKWRNTKKIVQVVIDTINMMLNVLCVSEIKMMAAVLMITINLKGGRDDRD